MVSDCVLTRRGRIVGRVGGSQVPLCLDIHEGSSLSVFHQLSWDEGTARLSKEELFSRTKEGLL